ncbi:MAG: pantetheine-phosphate adenylyltransferase [Dehalococcoidia bacterium]|nr:pantetheine-phosphate adenylyltransferase [Dehalococcoidia bacterium]
MLIGVYPGTFDPITKGHLDIIERASALCQELIIGVYENSSKRPLFPVKQRVELIEKAIAGFPNVRVESFQGLVVNFMHAAGARVMFRGLRAGSDFEREFGMTLLNKKLAPDVELVCLMASSQYQFLSSTLIKEFALLGGNLEDLVPAHVAVALKDKVSTDFPRD